jgi:hypothetical protein
VAVQFNLMKNLIILLTCLLCASAQPATPLDNEVSVKLFGAKGDGSTDDTTAIQAALNYVVANYTNGGTLYFPEGKYIVGGAVQSPGAANAQLIIPQIPGPAGIYTMTLRLRGPLFQAQTMSLGDPNGTNDGGAIIVSTITGPGNTAAVLGTYRADGYQNFNDLTVLLEDLTFQTAPNAQLSGVNLRYAAAARLRGVRVWQGQSPFFQVQPTLTTGTAIVLPANNNNAYTTMNDCSVVGFYNGYELNEHASGSDNTAWACMRAGVLPASAHSLWFGRFGVYHCPKVLVWTGGSRIRIDQLDIEHDTSATWKASTVDFDDPANVGGGDIQWSVITPFVGPTHTITTNGCANIILREIGTPYGGGSVTNVTNVTNVVTGSSSLFAGSGAPAFTPTNSPAMYINTNTSAVWYWFSGAWH